MHPHVRSEADRWAEAAVLGRTLVRIPDDREEDDIDRALSTPRVPPAPVTDAHRDEVCAVLPMWWDSMGCPVGYRLRIDNGDLLDFLFTDPGARLLSKRLGVPKGQTDTHVVHWMIQWDKPDQLRLLDLQEINMAPTKTKEEKTYELLVEGSDERNLFDTTFYKWIDILGGGLTSEDLDAIILDRLGCPLEQWDKGAAKALTRVQPGLEAKTGNTLSKSSPDPKNPRGGYFAWLKDLVISAGIADDEVDPLRHLAARKLSNGKTDSFADLNVTDYPNKALEEVTAELATRFQPYGKIPADVRTSVVSTFLKEHGDAKGQRLVAALAWKFGLGVEKLSDCPDISLYKMAIILAKHDSALKGQEAVQGGQEQTEGEVAAETSATAAESEQSTATEKSNVIPFDQPKAKAPVFVPSPMLDEIKTLMGIPASLLGETLNRPHQKDDYKKIKAKDDSAYWTDLDPYAVRQRFDKVFGVQGLGWKLTPVAGVGRVEHRCETRTSAKGRTFDVHIVTMIGFVFEYAVVVKGDLQYVQTSAFSDSCENEDEGYAYRSVFTSLMKQALKMFSGFDHFADKPAA
jgi:hypothetical protein